MIVAIKTENLVTFTINECNTHSVKGKGVSFRHI